MKKSSLALLVSLALAVGVWAPPVALAEHHHHHHPFAGVFPPRPFPGPPFAVHRFPPFAVRHFPAVVFAAPPLVYPPVVYAPPPAVYYPLPPAPSPPPLSRVIEYPNGRYELLGDGITTPFQWVWIPRPPSPPPPPPAAPVPAPPAQWTPPTSPSRLYRWTDEQGVTTWTDQWDKIPLGYRVHARQLDGPPS